MIHYTTKSLILLENRLVSVTRDGIFNGALVKLQHCRTLPKPAMFGNIKSCLKLLSLPFPLHSQLPLRLPSQFELPVPRAFLHSFLYVFAAMFCYNSCNLIKQFRGGTFKHLAYLSSSEKSAFYRRRSPLYIRSTDGHNL